MFSPACILSLSSLALSATAKGSLSAFSAVVPPTVTPSLDLYPLHAIDAPSALQCPISPAGKYTPQQQNATASASRPAADAAEFDVKGFKMVACYPGGTQSSEPYCLYSYPSFGSNRGTTLISRPSNLAHIAANPVLHSEELQISPEERAATPYEMRAIPGKGRGAFATRRLFRGDLIMAEHPVVLFQATLQPELGARAKVVLREAVDALPPLGRSLFMDMHGVGEGDDLVESQYDRNAFESSINLKDNSVLYHGVLPEPARLNHDCRPNTVYYWDEKTYTLRMFAARDISVGDELTDAYRDGRASREDRQHHTVSTYGFECGCSVCSLPPLLSSLSDERIAKINEFSRILVDWTAESEASLEMVESLIALYEAERLQDHIHDAYVLAAINYNSFGLIETAQMYAMLALEGGLLNWGENWSETPHLWNIINAPKDHWTWEKRLKLAQKKRRSEARAAAKEQQVRENEQAGEGGLAGWLLNKIGADGDW